MTHHRTFKLVWYSLFALLISSLLGACGDDASKRQRILGHWKAERVQVQGLRIPMGPEFFVEPNVLTSIDGDIKIPISLIRVDGNDVTLDTPVGLGLTFHFENNDRISFDFPFLGKLYYKRIPEPTQAGTPNKSTTHAPEAVAVPVATVQPTNQPSAPPATSIKTDMPVSWTDQVEQMLKTGRFDQIETFLMQVRQQSPENPLLDYYAALLQIQNGDRDGAVRSLHVAFQHGFRQFNLLESSPYLNSLRDDPRYQALLTRYKN